MNEQRPSPRVLLLGDYSNCHRSLAVGLRALGCEVVVASDGSRWMNCKRDVDISRRSPSKIGGIFHYLNMLRLLRGRLSGFDIAAVNDPIFCSLRPERSRELFDILKARNGAVFYTAMSTDQAFLDMLSSPDSPLHYSEWFVDGSPSPMYLSNPAKWEQWHNPTLTDYQNHFFNNIDGAVAVLYEYYLGMERRLGTERVAYGGIPIETSLFKPCSQPGKIDRVRLFLGRDRKRMLQKGSDLLEEAARRVVEKHPDKAELVIVENRPFSEFTSLLKGAHVVLDQIYSYTPATTALMSMAYGLNTVSGGEVAFYDFIGETENRPIINAPIELDALTTVIEDIVLHPELISERGQRSREFVVKHNDCLTVARRFLDFWQQRISHKNKQSC